MPTPNLFEFATKELAQDAALAYIISWANPKFETSYSTLHALATDLLKAILSKTPGDTEFPSIESIDVELQYKRIDLLVKINEREYEGNDALVPQLVIVIEDKVETDEHSNQIERYMESASQRFNSEETKIVAVLLKTGNVSRFKLPQENLCGAFLRNDLLKVLIKHRNTNDTIVDNFIAHLESLDCRTEKYKTTKVDDWRNLDWIIYQGYYNEIESRMTPEKGWNGLGSWGWSYVSNPAGGFFLLAASWV